MKIQGQPNVSEKQVTKKKTKRRLRGRSNARNMKKRAKEEKEKERKKNLELYKENLEKEALHAEENPFTDKAWEKAKETFYDPENCSPVKNLVWLEKWANNNGILMPKDMVCRIGTFVSHTISTIKWKVKAFAWRCSEEIDFEHKILFENEVGPMMSTKLKPGQVVMTITDPQRQLFAMKTKLWNPDGKKFVETRDSQTFFGNMFLDDINEYHNPQVCFPNGTTLKDCGINGADTLKSIHWFPYSENVVSSLPYYLSKKDTMEEDELE